MRSKNFAVLRMNHCFLSITADQTLFQGLNDFIAFLDRTDDQTTIGAAIVFTDNNILRNVNQTTSQVT
jgi:hypothetical protein